jgi:hypothetical protein
MNCIYDIMVFELRSGEWCARVRGASDWMYTSPKNSPSEALGALWKQHLLDKKPVVEEAA